MKLDKFYTKREVAKGCISFLWKTLNLTATKELTFLEPSAGNGSFSNQLKNCYAYDIFPEGEDIKEQDFLTLIPPEQNLITIGNPPFGSRSKTAISFFNKASEFSDVIAFIVPVSFMKWSVQKELDSRMKMIDFLYLEKNSFLDKGKEYSIRTVFQIWVKKGSRFDTNQKDLRMKKSPPISHPDFKIWQHNATETSRKYIEEDWEIATWRQGYKDYNSYFTREDYNFLKDQVYNTNLQFFYIKPLTEEARKIILTMDFNALAERNTSTPGFGKGDFVNYYLELKGDSK